MTTPKPSDIPQAIRDRAAAQMHDTLYDAIYRRLIKTYKRRLMLVLCIGAGFIGFFISLSRSFSNGYNGGDVVIYLYAIPEGIATCASALAVYLAKALSNLSEKEPEILRAGVAFLIHKQPSHIRLNTLKTIATAGAAAGQTRTITTIFFIGLGASIAGKELFGYVTTPIQTAVSIGLMLIYLWVVDAMLSISMEVQKASIDTDILKAIAYYEEYLAEEAPNPAPAPRQPAIASTPAPAANPTPTAARTTNHGQQPQPKQVPQAQPQRKKKRR